LQFLEKSSRSSACNSPYNKLKFDIKNLVKNNTHIRICSEPRYSEGPLEQCRDIVGMRGLQQHGSGDRDRLLQLLWAIVD
jgi:hypothetical protein